MSINFNELPKSAPNGLMENGDHRFKVMRAEVKTGTNGDYLSIALQSDSGRVYDNISLNEKPLNRYKLAQFLRAVKVTPDGDFEVKDILKLLPNKPLIANITTQESQNNYPARNIVNVFDEKIFKPVDDCDEAASAELPFTMDDNDAGADMY